MQSQFRRTCIIAALALSAPSQTLAHPGRPADNLVAGLMHPLSGLDHVLMILAISAWAALLPARGRIAIAACLATLVGIGTLVPVPGSAALEAAIAATIVGAGLLLAIGRQLPLGIAAPITALFAVIHGFAHGAEGPGVSAFYIGGLVLATGALAFCASTLVAGLQARSLWWRGAGASTALLGAAALLH